MVIHSSIHTHEFLLQTFMELGTENSKRKRTNAFSPSRGLQSCGGGGHTARSGTKAITEVQSRWELPTL